MFPLDYNPNATCEPVDGHHPNSDYSRVYPQLGRKLKEADIGKEFVRVYPYEEKYWSCIIDRPFIEYYKLISNTAQQIIFQESYPQRPDFKSEQLCLPVAWNDGYWAPAQIVVEQLKRDGVIKIINNELVLL